MRIEYQHVAREIIISGHNRRVYGERVLPGWILTVDTCYMYVPEVRTQDVLSILIESAQEEIEIRARGKDVGRVGISALNKFFIGEHQRIIGYAPSAEIGDKISLTVIGCLTPLSAWRGWDKGAQ